MDVLLTMKRSECAQASIEFSCAVSDDWHRCAQEREVDEDDVRAIVQNLLQNAYEASLEVEPVSDRVVEFFLGERGGKLAIEVLNRIASTEGPSFESTKPNPEEHGIGLKVVDRIAKSHGGVRRVDFDPMTRMITVLVTL